MLRDAYGFNSDVSSWDTSRVTDFSYLFHAVTEFNGDISSWNVSSALNLEEMLRGSAFDGDISGWDTSQATRFDYLLADTPFNRDISSWDISSGTTLKFMFGNAVSFNQNLCGWSSSLQPTANVSDMFKFSSCPNTGDPDLEADPVSPLCYECSASQVPSSNPSLHPSTAPSNLPSEAPSLIPSFQPSELPSIGIPL
jgi:surface protein